MIAVAAAKCKAARAHRLRLQRIYGEGVAHFVGHNAVKILLHRQRVYGAQAALHNVERYIAKVCAGAVFAVSQADIVRAFAVMRAF